MTADILHVVQFPPFTTSYVYTFCRGQDVSDFQSPDVILMADVVYYKKVKLCVKHTEYMYMYMYMLHVTGSGGPGENAGGSVQ